jgi:hypothetical protein
MTGAGKLILDCKIRMTMQEYSFYGMNLEYDECG